jgi:hypothetical protein
MVLCPFVVYRFDDYPDREPGRDLIGEGAGLEGLIEEALAKGS